MLISMKGGINKKTEKSYIIYPLALRANPATVPGVKLVRLVKLVKLVTFIHQQADYGWPFMVGHLWLAIHRWPFIAGHLWLAIYGWPSIK